MIYDLPSATDIMQVGGKAHALGAMLRAGLQVPEGFVVTVGTDVAALPELFAHFDRLQSPYVAVRSSAINEDGQGAAWAGQLDTFLNVDRRTLVQKIVACQQSVASERARAYAKHMNQSGGGVAVIVQKMVPSQVSGVAFSVHPVLSDAELMVIEAGFGLGEAIVSGHITPDTYVVHKQTVTLQQKSIGQQAKKLVRRADKTIWEEVTGHTQKLADAQIVQLSQLVKKVEGYFGFPVDVEWALVGDQFYILQSRPITTL